jgi:hypothetical protein
MNQYQVTVKPYQLFDWLDSYVREHKTAFPQPDGTYLRLERWEGIDRTATHPEYWRGRRKKVFWLMVTYSSQPTASGVVKALNRKVEKAVEFCLLHPSYRPILTIRCDKAELRGWLTKMTDQCIREGIIVPLAPEKQPDKPEPDKPNERTRERAEIFRKIKDAHPDWSYEKVAMEAMQQHPELGEINGETVRNAYRAMKWKWERSDRIR